MLLSQQTKFAALENDTLLTIQFENGDLLQLETRAHQYESVVFTFPPKHGALVMEIF